MATIKTPLHLLIIKELIWWLLTAAIVGFVLYPIETKINYQYTFPNVVFIIIAVTYFRYIILFKRIEFLHFRWIKFGIFLININLFIYLISREERLMGLYDSFRIVDFGKPFHHLTVGQEGYLLEYLRTEVNLFATAAIIVTILLNVRLLLSYWKIGSNRFTNRMQG